MCMVAPIQQALVVACHSSLGCRGVAGRSVRSRVQALASAVPLDQMTAERVVPCPFPAAWELGINPV